MNKIEKLTDVLEKDILTNIEGVINGLEELLSDSKTATDEVKGELKEVNELQKEFKIMLEEALSGDIEEDEAEEILEEIGSEMGM